VEITPSNCINCRLCENSCPFGAIEKPVPIKEIGNKNIQVRKFIVLSLIIPFLVVIGAWTGAQFHENLAMVNPKVRLAEELLTVDIEDNTIEFTEEIKAFKSSEKQKSRFLRKQNWS
jgi:NosR/NirI family nitrous oxide reductase transcriptional regulator